jgi:hypothetical protein
MDTLKYTHETGLKPNAKDSKFGRIQNTAGKKTTIGVL